MKRFLHVVRVGIVASIAGLGLWLVAPVLFRFSVHAVAVVRDGVSALTLTALFGAAAFGVWKLRAEHVRRLGRKLNVRQAWVNLTTLPGGERPQP